MAAIKGLLDMSPQKTSPKNVRIIVLVNRDEQKRLKLIAKQNGVSLGELARAALGKVK